jgi:D-glycero-alpha-D-manno-heptose-7-phosphate kinase
MTVVRATAPVRVCDAGGWTDTWFAGGGVVCSLAVAPGAQVTMEIDDAPGPVTLDIAATGERYVVAPGEPTPARHPLLEAALRTCPPPPGRRTRLRIEAAIPPGCGTGTSAAVVVALVAALRAAAGEPTEPAALARIAHTVETGLGLQSGVQDQHAAAFGGCNLIHVREYPDASVEPIDVAEHLVEALDERLVTVYLGRPHRSSQLHERVITMMEQHQHAGDVLAPMRAAATAAAAALRASDLEAYGDALRDNTDAQAGLHPDLVSDDAHALINLARDHGAAGWKVNGAGGEGGSVTIVAAADAPRRDAMLVAIDAVPAWQRLALHYSREGAVVHAAS